MLVKDSENLLLLIYDSKYDCWRCFGIISDIINAPKLCAICDEYLKGKFATAQLVQVEKLGHALTKNGQIDEKLFNILVNSSPFSNNHLCYHRYIGNSSIVAEIGKQRFEQ